MTTVHASTATQLVVDGPARGGKDWRGGRSKKKKKKKRQCRDRESREKNDKTERILHTSQSHWPRYQNTHLNNVPR